jgi:O-acetyl-ADP-ribose deacetylase
MNIEILRGDITTLKVDAIVNAANNSLMGGGGVDGAIHRAAGPQLKAYCFRLKGCETGQAKISPGFNLPAGFVIHAVGPVWNNGTENEEKLLEMCYYNSLQLALNNNIETIAFPCISTGAYRFPFEKAAEIALKTISTFLKENKKPAKVFLVVFSENDFQEYQRIYKKMIDN